MPITLCSDPGSGLVKPGFILRNSIAVECVRALGRRSFSRAGCSDWSWAPCPPSKVIEDHEELLLGVMSIVSCVLEIGN